MQQFGIQQLLACAMYLKEVSPFRDIPNTVPVFLDSPRNFRPWDVRSFVVSDFGVCTRAKRVKPTVAPFVGPLVPRSAVCKLGRKRTEGKAQPDSLINLLFCSAPNRPGLP